MCKERLLIYLRTYPTLRRYQAMNRWQTPKTTLKYNFNNKLYEAQAPVCIGLVLSYHFQRIWNEVEVLRLDFNHILELLNSDFLMISEEDVLRTVKMWVNFDLADRRRYFKQLLRCVRPDLSVIIIGIGIMCFKTFYHNSVFLFLAQTHCGRVEMPLP